MKTTTKLADQEKHVDLVDADQVDTFLDFWGVPASCPAKGKKLVLTFRKDGEEIAKRTITLHRHKSYRGGPLYVMVSQAIRPVLPERKKQYTVQLSHR